jgi:hypothetical protein
MPLRISAKSRAKSSSTGGRFPTNSFHASPDSPPDREGRCNSATGAPLRTISISSPAFTRLITAEKFRATSVALIRTMLSAYQINQIYSACHGARSKPGSDLTISLRGWRRRVRCTRRPDHDVGKMGPRLAVTADVHAGQPAFLLALVAVQLALSDRGAWLDQVNRQLSRPCTPRGFSIEPSYPTRFLFE